MIMTFSKRDKSRNAAGCRLDVGPMTEAEVTEMRAQAAREGFIEGFRTRKLSDAELSAKTQKGKSNGNTISPD